MGKEKFEMIAKTFQGLEEVLAKELIALGADDVEILRRGVGFKGDLGLMYKANLCCRTALRILKPIYKFTAADADEVYDKIKEFDWSKYLDPSKTFAIDSVVYSDLFRHSKFISYKVKDAIADQFREKCGKRPSVRIDNPDLQISIHVNQDICTVCLDSSGESLHKRGYRVEQTEAPINEVLAAGLLLIAGWDGQCDFIDPMCGSGTLVVEAALIARNIPPGIYRNGFGFEKWADFDKDLLDELYNDETQEREFDHKIFGSDILKDAISITEENVKSAGVSKDVHLKVCPIQDLPKQSDNALVVFNPPYGERITGTKSLEDLYSEIGTKLKRDFTGMTVWIITVPNEKTQKIGLAPSERIEMQNGGLDCEFRKYEMFSGRRNDYVRDKKEGRFNDDRNSRRRDNDEDSPWKQGDRKERSRFFNEKNKERSDRRERNDRSDRYESRERKPYGEKNNDRKEKFGSRDRYSDEPRRERRFDREKNSERDGRFSDRENHRDRSDRGYRSNRDERDERRFRDGERPRRFKEDNYDDKNEGTWDNSFVNDKYYQKVRKWEKDKKPRIRVSKKDNEEE